MGQNNSQTLQSRSQLAQIWVAHDKDPNVFINRITHEQVNRQYIRILIKDLPRETALFSTRMNNHQPYICRLLYFHPAGPESKAVYDHEKEFREMLIYTDRFLHLKDWNREKMILALHGLRKLIGIHGPIKITEHMLCENQYGEIKVWISQNPVNNHPDSKYMSEEQSMGDFAAILTKKNQELANLLIGCNTLKEASEKLTRPHREEHSPHQNYSHRASGSGDIVKKKLDIKQKGLLTPYKNVFGDINDSVKTKPEAPVTPKHNHKMFDNYPQSSFLPREEDSTTPTSNSTTLSRYREFLFPNKIGTPNEEKITNKSNPKMMQTTSETYMEVKRREDHPEAKSNYRPNKVTQNNNMDASQKSKQFLTFTNSNVKSQEMAKPFVFQHRFQTATNLSPNVNGFNSPKGRAEPTWNSNESSTFSTAYNQRREAKQCSNPGFKQQRIKNGGFDITIINNNVNNYINNITHNHIVKVEKSPTEHVHQFRTQTKNQEPTNINSVHSSNQFLKNSQKGREKQYNIPVFIQQKKKPSNQWSDEQPSMVVKSKSNNNISRKYTVSSNPQEVSCESPQVANEKKVEQSFQATNKEKKHQKAFNFTKNQDPIMSSNKTIPTNSFNNNYPLTPNPSTGQHFSSFQRGYNNSFEFKVPLRTKTTEFYQKGRDGPKKDELQNKSFTQNELEKSIYEVKNEHKQVESVKQIIPIEVKPEKAETSIKPPSKQTQQPKPEQKKLQFKKQLRNEFKFLLGGEPKQKQEQPNPPKNQQKTEVKQGNLKDKIMRKQIVFAQLKKQAFDLLQ